MIPASGTRVETRDGRHGQVKEVQRLFTGSHPGSVFKTLLAIRVEGEQYDWTGDLSWFKSRFKRPRSTEAL